MTPSLRMQVQAFCKVRISADFVLGNTLLVPGPKPDPSCVDLAARSLPTESALIGRELKNGPVLTPVSSAFAFRHFC